MRALALVVLLAACGGDDDAPAGSGEYSVTMRFSSACDEMFAPPKAFDLNIGEATAELQLADAVVELAVSRPGEVTVIEGAGFAFGGATADTFRLVVRPADEPGMLTITSASQLVLDGLVCPVFGELLEQ